jgi:hypothetical protein
MPEKKSPARKAVRLGVAALLVAHAAMSCAAGARPIEYVDEERTHLLAFEDGQSISADIDPLRPSAKQREKMGEVTSALLEPCSTPAIRCVGSGMGAFAVPNDFSLSTRSYTAFGVVFTVLECVRQAAGRCQVAVIEADCNVASTVNGHCRVVPGGRKPDSREGWIQYFIYNEDFGVTALGWSAFELPITDRLKAARRGIDYSLRGEVGLLKPERH